MLQIYTDKHDHIGTLTECKNQHVKRALFCDEKTLYFDYPVDGPHADSLLPEVYVRTKTAEFVVKEVDTGTASEWMKVTAIMNTEGIENCTFAGGFEAVEKTAAEVLDQALAGSDWKVGARGGEKHRTIRKEDDCNAWDILEQVAKTFRVELTVDTLAHVVNITDHRGMDRGTFIMEGVNLRKLEVNRDSYDFYTELIPIGKNGLTLMDDPADPVLYLSNYTYSEKHIRRIWRDERYTQVSSLREDAAAKLAEACQPMNGYKASVKDLAAASLENTAFFRFDVGDTVTLISKSRHVKERQRVVTVDEYEDPERDDTVELNTAAKPFALIQKSEAEAAAGAAQRLANDYTDDCLTDRPTGDEVTEIVEGVTAAQLAKLATKDDLTTVRTYADQVAQGAQEGAERAAKRMADQAEADAKKAFQLALRSYYTAEQTDQAITDAVAGSETGAGGVFARKTDVQDLAAATEAAIATTTNGMAEELDRTDAQIRATMETKEEANQLRATLEQAMAAADAARDRVTGQGKTDGAGTASVRYPAAFAGKAAGYFVALQPRASGVLHVSESDTAGFTVKGDPAIPFDWVAVLK